MSRTVQLSSWGQQLATTTTTSKRFIHASRACRHVPDDDNSTNNKNDNYAQLKKQADDLVAEADASFEREDYMKALDLYREVLQLRTTFLGAEHPDVGEAHHLVGETLWTLSQFKEAEAALVRSLAILRKNLGPKHKAVGTVLKNIAECRQAYVDEHEGTLSKAKATQLLEQVLPLAREASEIAHAHATAAVDGATAAAAATTTTGREGDNDEDYLDALYGLGELYLQLDRYAEALPCFEKNLPYIEKNQGADSMDTLLCWRNLAACYKAVGDQAKWEHAERQLTAVETQWQNETGSVMPDVDALRQTMKSMGMEKELADFNTTLQEMEAKNQEKKQRATAKKARSSGQTVTSNPQTKRSG